MIRSRTIRAALLALLSLWFAVIVPGHQRGFIRVPGAPAAENAGCCAAPSVAANDACCPSKGNGSDPDPSPVKSCAICQTVAKLSQATVFVIDVPELGLIDVLPVPELVSLTGQVRVALPPGRAPPTA